MNRKEFLDRLEMLLNDLPEEEREEALQYYLDYFDDAGAANEGKVIEELGSPEKVAAIIKTGMEPGKDEYSEYGETGYTDTRFEDKKVPESRSAATNDRQSKRRKAPEYEYANTKTSEQKEPWTSDILKVVLIIAIIIVAIPTIGPIILGLFLAFIGLFIGLAIAGIILTALGIGFVGIGIGKMITLASGGIVMSGTGLILFAIGILITVLIIKAAISVIPPVFRWVVEWIRKPFSRKAV